MNVVSSMMTEYRAIVKQAAQQAQATMQAAAMAGTIEPLYLYYKKSTETESGALLLVPQSAKEPEGYSLATGEALRGVPYEYYFQWVYERAKRLPILAYGSK